MKNDTKIKAIIFIFPILLILIFLLRKELIVLGTFFPACPSKTFFDIYCPGCGNTRSVQHLLNGDILGSLRYNPFPVFGGIFAILAYIELITASFAGHKKLIPRNRTFWVAFIIVMSLYYIVRNFVCPF